MAVRLEKQDSIGHIVLDRPPANSYDKAFMDELEAVIDDAVRDDAVKDASFVNFLCSLASASPRKR